MHIKLDAIGGVAGDMGSYELFKTSATFDGTAKNAKWLDGDVGSVQKLAPAME